MTRGIAGAALLLILHSGVTFADDPARAIGEARAAIEGKEYQHALSVLQDAIRNASFIVDQKKQDDALAAIHFYRALAFQGMSNDSGTRAELREFFRIRPGKSTLDPRKYPPRFVELFTEENRRLTMTPQDATAFDQHYPGFDAVTEASPSLPPLESWAVTPEYQLLATDAERVKWMQLHDDTARSEFISDFWRRRDPEPHTDANEWRNEFYRRVAFADSVFSGEASRGALTDRGKVFILLGKPARVYREPIPYRYGNYQGLNGTAER